MQKNGFTLIEMVLYIGIIAVLLGGLTTFLINTANVQSGLSPALRIKETASTSMLLLSSNITGSQNISTTASTLGVNPSTLVLTDASGHVVSIDVVEDTVSFSGTDVSVARLRLTKDAGPSSWLTDNNLNVSMWKVDAVRDSVGVLRGIRIEYAIDSVDASVSDWNFSGSSTFPLTPNTIEI